MAKKASVWTKGPVTPEQIVVQPSQRIVVPKNPVGVKKKRPKKVFGSDFIMQTLGGKPLVCSNPHCYTRIDKHVAAICCSPECTETLKGELQLVLEILEGKREPTELPFRMRRQFHLCEKKSGRDKKGPTPRSTVPVVSYNAKLRDNPDIGDLAGGSPGGEADLSRYGGHYAK
ncbi:MAG: hypothetical protein ACEQSB_06275 [Undibacterium sp.]